MSRVLLIDDDASILALLRTSFQKRGYAVVATVDPEEGVRLARGQSVDGVVLDLNMPRISGWDVLALLRAGASTCHVPIVILSSSGAVPERVRGLREGADDFVVKPFDPEELIARVERLIDRRKAGPAGLVGSLEENPCRELLQNLEQNRKTGVLEIHSGNLLGRIRFYEGRLATASFDGYEGTEAVLALLELQGGSFHFVSDSAVEPPASKGRGVLGILIMSAWLADELRARSSFLPSEGDSLRVRKGCSPTMDFEQLPIEAILEMLGRRGGATLAWLFEQRLASPAKVRLAVAWLCEEGALEVSEKRAEAKPRSFEGDLDMAIRELLQVVVFQGFDLGSVQVRLFFDPASWKRVAGLLSRFPAELTDDGEVARRILSEGGGVMSLPHGSGSLELSFSQLDSEERAGGSAAAVVVILSGQYAYAPVALRRLESSAPGRAMLAVGAMDAEGQHSASTWIGSRPRWRQLSSPVVGPVRLLTELSDSHH